MIAQTDVPVVINRVRELLAKRQEGEDIPLEVEGRDYRVEDDWLYVVVRTTRPGIRALVYADTLSEIEKQLRREHIDHVLLVPSSPEFP